jgi:hypothetical protein
VLFDVISNGKQTLGHIVNPDKIADGFVGVIEFWDVEEKSLH